MAATGAGAGCTMSRWICDSDIFRILWIFVEISRWILVLLKNLWVRFTARLTLASAGAAGTTAMTAGRLADLLAMIDEHTAAGTMSGKQVAAICSMIDASCHDDTAIRCEKGRRWRARDVGSTRCYKQLRRLGKGAFGVVVKAQHRDTGEIVALKTIRARDGARRPDVGELLREACFMVACRGHPILVSLHGVVRNPDTKEYCLVMNYVGPTLRETVDRHMEQHGQAFPEADVRRVMRQLLTGARAMHERGIIHRGIKPKNILVDEDGGIVKLCDYGVAMFTAKAELPFAQAGTPSYMAPEVLLEKPDYDERVDLWSLGCVMAELLSGQVLFERDDKMDQLRMIFDTLGVPGKRTWQGFKSTLLVQEVQQWRAQQQEAPHHDRLRELFPEEVLSEEGFHVLKGLLRCNPSKRLTAAKALRSSWFKDDAINTPEADFKIGGMVLVRETVVSLLWVLISAWARFRQATLSIGASALLRHKALPKSLPCEL